MTVPHPSWHPEKFHIFFITAHAKMPDTSLQVVESLKVFPVRVQNDKARVDRTLLMRYPPCFCGFLQGPTDQSCHCARLTAPGVPEHGQVPAEHFVWINGNHCVRCERRNSNWYATVLSLGFDY